ncbi:MAG: hypothetical protein V4820_04180 [Pseudomonadota bacterium]
MKANALQQAKARLRRTKDALTEMERATRFSDLDEGWSNFLVASKLAFAKLGAGAKGDRASEGWFSRKLGQQKTDPLLSYLYQARNAEEHGLDRSIEHAYDIRVLDGVVLEVDVTFESNGDLTFRNTLDPSEVVRFALKGTLKPVTDKRSGHAFAPPTEHLGCPLQDTSVFGIADAMIIYLERLIAEATQMPLRE